MNFQKLKNIFSDHGCQKIYVKKLSSNDNSKNQVYLGGNFDILNIIPMSNIRTEEAGDWSKERFKASINFAWLNNDGNKFPAPNAQLILYPKYPEVRFSGFLAKCDSPPSELMTQRLPERLLFLGITNLGQVLGYVSHPDSIITREFNSLDITNEFGIFKIVDLLILENPKDLLFKELVRIHNLGWIKSKSLTKNGLVPCIAPQCGGYTLEAELGIIRNGFAEPDFYGWEVKNFGVKNFEKLKSSIVTLFTPEPTDGLYKSKGVEFFIRKYGYPDKNGKPDRLNFGGIHKVNKRHPETKLRLQLIGFDIESNRIRNTNGKIALVDDFGNEAASWSFASLLLHWTRKHNQACYVPSIANKIDDINYKYGSKIIIGMGTYFQFFLKQMSEGNVFYDPGIKLEGISSSKPKAKKRSQFRIKSENIGQLYYNSEIISLME